MIFLKSIQLYQTNFYKILNHQTYSNIDKIINIDDVIIWLDIQKHKLKETLIKSYKKGIDYEIKKVTKPKGTCGQKKEIIIISINCFKKICQLMRMIYTFFKILRKNIL